MDERNTGTSVDSLGLGGDLTKNLKTAGIATVADLEAALQDEITFKNRVYRCGDKSVQLIKQALAGRHASPSPASESNNAHTQTANKSSDTPKEKTKTASGIGAVGVTALIIISCLALPVMVGLYFIFFGGRHLSRENYRLLTLLVVGLIVFVFFGLFKRSAAIAEHNNIFGWKIKIYGPVAAVIGLFGTLTVFNPPPPHRVVQFYLDGGDEASNRIGFGNFTVHYARPNGPAKLSGMGYSIVMQDVPWDADAIEVIRIECVGYVPEKKLRGEVPPWSYPIRKDGESGSVHVHMAKEPPEKESEPTEENVRDLWKARGLTADDIRRPGKFDKDHVHLTIENASDRVIDCVILDCTRVLPMAEEPPVDQGHDTEFAYRNIAPGTSKRPSAFSGFWKPSGWFAVYVRYDDQASNRKVRKAVGVYNLFNVREPRLVIQRKIGGGDGIDFEIDERRSQLEE